MKASNSPGVSSTIHSIAVVPHRQITGRRTTSCRSRSCAARSARSIGVRRPHRRQHTASDGLGVLNSEDNGLATSCDSHLLASRNVCRSGLQEAIQIVYVVCPVEASTAQQGKRSASIGRISTSSTSSSETYCRLGAPAAGQRQDEAVRGRARSRISHIASTRSISTSVSSSAPRHPARWLE